MPCFLNFWPWLKPLVPGGMMNVAWPRDPSSGCTDATTMCTLAMPPLVAHVLVPLMTHSSVASSYLARVMMADDVRAGARLRRAERREQRLVDGAEHLGQPLPQLLGRSGRGQRRGGEPGAQDRQARCPRHPRTSPRRPSACRVRSARRPAWRRAPGVQADLGRLLDDRPRRLLALVPLRGRRPDDVRSEVVHPVPDLDDVVGAARAKTSWRLVLSATSCTGGGTRT